MIFDTDNIDNLGQLAEVMRKLRDEKGWTRGSALYVMDKVWWED